MVKYFILIRTKKTKKKIGAIPIKKGVSKTTLRKLIRRSNKKVNMIIITESQLKRMLKGLKRVKLGRKTKRSRKRKK